MNISKNFILSLSFLSTGFAYSMHDQIFPNKSFVRVVGGPEKFRDSIMRIEGTTQEIWDIDDVDGSEKALGIWALRNYMLTQHPPAGQVYYVQNIKGMMGRKFCLHESWLQEEDFDEDDVPVSWGTRKNSNGEWVTEITTVRDMQEEAAKRALLRPTLDSFKKEYIDKYYYSAEIEDLLVEEAPPEIKKWFNDLGNDSKPLLIYGAYGVGKTMTTQALVKKSGMALCYVPFPSTMEIHWNKNQFEPKYLDDIDKNVCVIVDGIEELHSSILTYLYRLIDLCNNREKVNLVAIAYHAKEHMPKVLYNKFQSVKFPMPNHDKKIKILKSYLSNRKLSPDIDDMFLSKLVDEIPRCTPRALKQVVSGAVLAFFEKREHDDQEVILNSSDFVDSVQEGIEEEKKFTKRERFDECE